MRHYDVIIIGSGINSLSSAALLGKAKKKVLVLEARDTIGGLASTIEFSSGFRCNAINDSIKWINPNLFSELDINSNNLNIIKPNISHIALGDHKNPIFF
ncbi:MAG: NAD(P)-binding protein, partial [Candidatus Neomarinimicrobiota bacterium]